MYAMAAHNQDVHFGDLFTATKKREKTAPAVFFIIVREALSGGSMLLQ